ncbi:MAG: hypothetical protein WBO55_10980 [Rhizobiaceae bacterium]
MTMPDHNTPNREDTSWTRIAMWTVLFQIAWYWRGLMQLFVDGAMPDTDDFVRLQQVRDFMSGQGWYDLVQHRMDPPFGADLHWSRLVDLPIAGLIWFFNLFAEPALAERIVLLVWPTLLLVATVLVVVRICLALAPRHNALLSVLFTVTCITALVEYAPGRIDHHSVQILLFCLALLGLVESRKPWGGLLLGASIAASLSVGLESVTLFPLMLAWVSLGWVWGSDRGGRNLLATAIGLAVATLILYPLNYAPSQWLVARCDANSLVYLCANLAIAAGFALLAWQTPRLTLADWKKTALVRLASGAVLGVAILGGLLAAFPHCAQGPLGEMGSELTQRWLVHVAESMTMIDQLQEFPELWFYGIGYCTFLTIIGALILWKRGRQNPEIAAVYAIFVLSYLSSFLLYRGLRIGVFASIPICVLAAEISWNWLQSKNFSLRPFPAMVQTAVVILLLSPVWLTAGSVAFPNQRSQAVVTQAIADARQGDEVPDWKKEEFHAICNLQSQYERLGSLPSAYVMGDINSGAAILAFTDHAVVGGPYHRNGKAILDIMDFFETDLQKPERIARDRAVDYVAWCDLGRPLTQEQLAGDNLAVHILQGTQPAWLEKLSTPQERLFLFKVNLQR